MDINILKNVAKRMLMLQKEKVLEEKKIFVGPADDISMYLIRWLRKHGYEVAGVFTAEEDFAGQRLMGFEIVRAEDLLIPYRKQNIVLLTDSSIQYLNRKLDYMEYYYNIQRFVVTEPVVCTADKIYQKLKNMFWRRSLSGIHMVYEGKKVYGSLKKQISEKQMGKETRILLFPYNSIGDMYILSVYKKQGNRLFYGETVLVVTGNVCRQTAERLGFANVISIQQSDMDAVIRLKDTFYDELKDVSILHYNYSFLGIAEEISNSSCIDFYQNYQYLVFDQKYEGLYHVKEDLDAAEEFCRENNIVKGKSVILAPYAKSILQVSVVFWESLAAGLKKNGYHVYTNCNGTSELPVAGTKKIFFPLEIANSVAEYAGCFIGLRSGLCDLICCADCMKIIIYPKWVNDNMSIKQFYTFQHTDCNSRLAEFECRMIPKKEEAQKIAEYLQSL